MYTWIYFLLIHAVTALQYRVAVQSTEDSVVSEYAHIIGERNGVYEYKPIGDSNLYHQGCIGLLTDDGFTCHSLYKLPEDGRQREAVKCYIGPNGAISQVQLVDGPRSEFIVETAQVVPRPAISAVSPAKKSSSKDKLSDKWKNRKHGEEETSDEQEQGFWEKYWLYIVPVGLVLLSNAMKPKN